jgi:predicted aldo/keto reductase-like oxidoreductase
MPGKEIRETIAKILGDRRKDVIIQGHIGSTDVNRQYDISRDVPTIQKYFEDMLRMYGGHIELGMMFFIDSDDDYKNIFETEFVNYVLKLKKQGDIGHIGFSSHNPKTAMRAIKTGVPDTMMFSINPAFDMLPFDEYVFDHSEKNFGKDLFRGLDPDRAALYTLCEQMQVGITVMKTLGAGKLLSAEHTPFAKPFTTGQCIHYALSRPGVASVLLGCNTRAQMEDALNYFNLTDEEKDYAPILGTIRNDFKGSCVYCSHCQPCPVEIDIASVMKYLDIAKLNPGTVPPNLKSHYMNMTNKGDACTSCGHCESRCPFGVPVIKNMELAEELLKV